MLLTYEVRHNRDLSNELAKARKVAEYAIESHSNSTVDVGHIGLKLAIANQVLRKYGNDRRCKAVKNVVLIVPGQGTRYDVQERIVRIPCLRLSLDVRFLPLFNKVNQIELDAEYAFVTVTIDEPPGREVERRMGVDLNSTGHVAVAANPTTGKVQKYGKEAPHIHKRFSKMRRHLYVHGHPKVAKKIKHKENNKVRDINHKVSSHSR